MTRVRWLGLSLAAAVVCAAAGLGVGDAVGQPDPPDPAATEVAPVLAEQPAYPRDPEVVVREDRDYPTLERGLESRRATIGDPPFEVALRVPQGWVVSEPELGEVRLYPEPYTPETLANTYFVRIEFVGRDNLTPNAALTRRISDLQSAGEVQELDVEQATSSSFVATYVAGEYRRLTMEQFLAEDDAGEAKLSISVIGRERDRDGLADLLDLLVGSVEFL